jgi:hypothetical protein|tara:strand:- start:532 stop:993 length:462 start_codon:yes stop_codon:yes gene_type:complete
MPSFIRDATHVHDIDADLDYVEITYKKQNRTYTDYINTEPLGWTRISCTANYYRFLDAMVVKTVEVLQRMAELALEDILHDEHEPRLWVRLMHAVRILDPTFQPPRIDMESAWQVEFIAESCKKYIPSAIYTCISKKRLSYFNDVMQRLAREE